MSSKPRTLPDGRIPDRLPDGRPAVAWRSRWTEGVLPLWLVATAPTPALVRPESHRLRPLNMRSSTSSLSQWGEAF